MVSSKNGDHEMIPATRIQANLFRLLIEMDV